MGENHRSINTSKKMCGKRNKSAKGKHKKIEKVLVACTLHTKQIQLLC